MSVRMMQALLTKCAPFQKLPIFYGYQYDPDFEIVSISGSFTLSTLASFCILYHNTVLTFNRCKEMKILFLHVTVSWLIMRARAHANTLSFSCVNIFDRTTTVSIVYLAGSAGTLLPVGLSDYSRRVVSKDSIDSGTLGRESLGYI